MIINLMQFMTLIFCSYSIFGAQDQENSGLAVELES